MNRLIETSALVRWLLAGPQGDDVRRLLGGAEKVYASRLALAEARRALVRLVATAVIEESRADTARALLEAGAAAWQIVEVTAEQLDRAAAPFPAEPIRVLDALHLAAALQVHAEVGPLEVVSTDARVRKNARLLGLDVAPADPPA